MATRGHGRVEKTTTRVDQIMAKKETLESIKKRGLVLSILRDKTTKAPLCMCYQEQVEAVAELMIGEKWRETHEVVDSPPAIILSDIQVLLAMAPVMQVKMPRGGAGMGQMFQPARGPQQQFADDDDDGGC